MIKKHRYCPHCHSGASPVSCTKCMREMCEACISYGDAGKLCGLCLDREDGYKRYQMEVKAGNTSLEFDEWYDKHA